MLFRLTLKGAAGAAAMTALLMVLSFALIVGIGLLRGPEFDPPWIWVVGLGASAVGVVKGVRSGSLVETTIGVLVSVVLLFGVALVSVPWRGEAGLGFPFWGFVYFGLGAAGVAGIGFALGRFLRHAVPRNGAS